MTTAQLKANPIEELREFVKEGVRTTCLQGYAAESAEKTLLANSQDALGDGNTDNLVTDVDEVIVYLREFQAKAREVLPVANGGLA